MASRIALPTAQYRCNCSPCTPTPFHPNAPSPAKSRDSSADMPSKVLYCTSIFVLARVYPRMQTKTLRLLLFIRSADFLPCKYLLSSALTRSRQGLHYAPPSPRFGEILNLTGSLINTIPTRNAVILCV
ncbi:hypothetical protein V8C43DRAFT_274073 [Trichoderma afarasin]